MKTKVEQENTNIKKDVKRLKTENSSTEPSLSTPTPAVIASDCVADLNTDTSSSSSHNHLERKNHHNQPHNPQDSNNNHNFS